MRVSQAFVLFASVGLTLGGCQTLTEELPARPSNPPVQLPVLPPIVNPGPIPDVPTGGAPPPTSDPGPAEQPPSGGEGDIPDNTNPVTKVGAKVYFLECDGVQVPDSGFATSAQVGCRIHFDCTPKDAFNNPTQTQGSPQWTFSPDSIVSIGNPNEFTPTVTAKAPGTLTAYVVIDGVTSNTVTIDLYN